MCFPSGSLCICAKALGFEWWHIFPPDEHKHANSLLRPATCVALISNHNNQRHNHRKHTTTADSSKAAEVLQRGSRETKAQFMVVRFRRHGEPSPTLQTLSEHLSVA